MQAYALTVEKFLDHAAKWARGREVITADGGKTVGRISYADLRARSNRMSGALAALSLERAARVATLGWNTQHHFEMYYALMGAGYVCHTLNPRLTVRQLAGMINEADDKVLAIACDLLPLFAELAPLCPTLEHLIVMDEIAASVQASPALQRAVGYEALLEAHGRPVSWGGFDEQSAAGLCYTSGTTGQPKGVLYTHRSNYLHTLRALQADGLGIGMSDVLLLAVPMFHANAWGLPFAAPAVGAKLVLPGRKIDGVSLAMLMREHEVSVAVGIQTVWLGLLDHLDEVGGELPALKRVLIGGANCPDALIRRMEQRLGARVQTSWGMTELSPIGTLSPPEAAPAGPRASGRPAVGLDLKLTDANGVELAEQRGPVGHLKVKGASVIERYFKSQSSELDEQGYFDTGDLASIDAAGNVTICGRSKDLIKSGGEWINPLEIEELAAAHPAVALAAVIGRMDEKWGERPVLIVEPRQGATLEAAEVLNLLRGRIPSWWMPEEVVLIGLMPLAATGKIDKSQLRLAYGLPGASLPGN